MLEYLVHLLVAHVKVRDITTDHHWVCAEQHRTLPPAKQRLVLTRHPGVKQGQRQKQDDCTGVKHGKVTELVGVADLDVLPECCRQQPRQAQPKPNIRNL